MGCGCKGTAVKPKVVPRTITNKVKTTVAVNKG
jgi:hypothetical protein